MPGYTGTPVDELTTRLSKLAWSQVRNRQEVRYDLRRINQLYGELAFLCGRHEELFKIRNDIRAFLHKHVGISP
jgi:hypothetical protein